MSYILKHDGTCEGDLNVQGSVILRETTVTSPTETISIVAPDSVTSTYTLVLPPTVGTADQVLSTGSTPGTMEWVTAGGGGTAAGSDTQIQFNNSTAFGGSADLTWDGTNIATSGGIKLKESAGDDTHYVTIQAPASISSDLTLTLPPDAGAASEFLQTDGSGNLIWSTAGGSSSLIDAFGEQITTTQITTISSTLTFRGIAWSPTLNLFAAVPASTTANAWTSTDGIEWTERTGTAGTWYDMVWAPSPLNKFVAVSAAQNDRIQYSSNGITWSVATNAPPLSSWRSIAYSPTLGTGLGRLAVVSSSTDTYMYSDDGGDTWITAGTTLPSGMKSLSILWVAEINSGSGAFVAPGYNNTKFYKSVDGIVWSEITILNISANSIAWSPTLSKLIIIGNSVKNVLYSTDEGVTWSDTNVTNNTDATWNKVIWSPVINKFIAVASNPKIIMLSADGEIWENSITTDSATYSIAESASLKTVVTGTTLSSVQTIYSTKKLEGSLIGKKLKADTTLTINNATISSGFTTTEIALPNNTGIKGEILVNAGSGLMAWTSPKITRALDTTTLEYNVSADETTNWREVEYSPTLGIFVAVGFTGTTNIMYSYDGTTWDNSALNLTGLNVSTVSWDSIKWVASPVNKFVICAHSGGTVNNDRIAYSSDGLVWTSINVNSTSYNSDAAASFRSIVVSYDLNRLIIGSTSGNKLASIPLTSDISSSWAMYSVSHASNGGTFIPEYGIFLLPTQSSPSARFSYTGTGTWESVSVGPYGVWYDVAWSPELGVCVICGSSTADITTSTGDPRDSANWTSQETGTGGMNTVSWVKELSLFIAVGTSILTSPDGSVWTEITTTNVNWGHVYSPEHGKLIIVGHQGTNRTAKLTAKTVNNGAFKTNSLLLEDFNPNNNTVTIELPDLSGDASYTLVLPTNIGAAGTMLTDTAGNGILDWTTPSAPSAAGSNTQIQFNNSTVTSGSADLTWNDSSKALVTTGSFTANEITQTSNDFYIASTVTGVTDAQGLALHGDYIYIASPSVDRVYVYKTDPFSDDVPTLVSSITDSTNLDTVTNIMHNGNTVFVGGSTSSNTGGFLTSLNVTDPGSPVVLDKETHSSVKGVARMAQIGGTHIILGSATTGDTIVFNTSNASNITGERLENAAGSAAYGLDVVDDKLYMCSGNILTVDKIVYDPDTFDGFQMSSSAISGLTTARALKVQGNYAYIASYNAISGANGITVVDVSKPSTPVKVGTIYNGDPADTLGLISDIAISGKYLYVIGEENDELQRIDISDPTALVGAGRISTGLDVPSSLEISGSYLYITNRGSTGSLVKVNIGSAQLPQISCGNIRSTTSIIDKDSMVQGNLNVGSGISVRGSISSQGPISTTGVFYIKGSANFYGTAATYIKMKAPSSVTTHTLTLPGAKGTAGTVLTDAAGNGTLSWAELGGTKGTVIQLISSTTGVTLNARSGKITTYVLNTATNTTVSFTVTNSSCSATNVVLANVSSYAGSGFVHCNVSAVSAGTFDIVLINSSGSTLDATCEISFTIF